MDVSVKMEKMEVECGGGGEEPASGSGCRRQPPPPLQLQPPTEQSPPLAAPTASTPAAAHVGRATGPVKRPKPIPPPLDLRMSASPLLCPPRTAIPVISPSSPYHQKNLPFRKR